MVEPLRLGTHGAGDDPGAVHLSAEIEGETARLRGTNDAGEIRLTKKGAGTLGRWLLDWSRPNRRLRLWGQAEMVIQLEVSRSTARNYTKRRDFPKPVATVGAGPLWEEEAVRAWYRHCRPRSGRPRGTNET